MKAYFLPLFILSILTVLEDSNRLKNLLKNKYFYSFLALFLIFFIGLRSEIGCDWLRYKQMFDELTSTDFFDILINNFVSGPNYVIKELGHVVLTLMSGNIYVLNLIYALIFVAPLFYYCSKIKRVYLSLLISYPYYVVVVGMGPIRQAACISILMLSIILVSKNKYLYHFFLTTFSLLIHQFSIIFNCFLLIPLIPKILREKLTKPYITAFIVISALVLYSSPSYIIRIYYYLTIPSALLGEAKGAIFIWLINFLPSLIFLLNKRKFNFHPYLNKIFTIFSIFEIVMLPLVFIKSVVAYRLLLYVFPSSIYITSYIPEINVAKIKSCYIINSIIFISFLSFICWINFAYHSSCWLPYKNLIFLKS